MIDVSLPELRAFVTVAQQRSFRRAADLAGVSRSSLSHAMRALERRLGTRLLHRTTRSVALTAAGDQLLARLAPMLREMDEMLGAVGHDGNAVSGVLRINANEGGARWLLWHAVPSFLRQYPRVSLELLTDGRLIDIVAEGFDAGVRLREAVPQDMVAVPFGGDTRFVAVAAPAYVAEHGSPETPKDLERHRCIRQRLPSGKAYRWEFARDGEELAVDVPGDVTLDNNTLMIEAAIGGLGIAFVPEAYARPALDEQRLITVLDEWSPPGPGLCLYYSRNRHLPAALRVFIEVLRSSDAIPAYPLDRDPVAS